MYKYNPLRDYLAGQSGQDVTCSFAEIEKIIGDALPKSAHVYAPWWANETNPDTTHVQCRAWLDAGYSAYPDLERRRIRFAKN